MTLATQQAIDWAKTRKAPALKTQQQYQAMYDRMYANNQYPGTSPNARTRAVERAAWRWMLSRKILELEHSAAINPEDAAKIERMYGVVERMEAMATAAMSEAAKPNNQATAVQRNTKRKSLRGLKPEWRERIAAACAKSEYSAAIRVALCIGCRPEELVKGVTVERLESGAICFTVQGAKVSEGKLAKGQQWRKITLPADHAIAATLAPGEVKIRDAKRFNDAVSHYADKCYPGKGISPYTARHQFASDLKAAGLDDSEIAKALGHNSTATLQQYGLKQCGKGGYRIGVEASREPRVAKAREAGKAYMSSKSRGVAKAAAPALAR